MKLLRKKPEPVPKPTGALPAGANHDDWVLPVDRIRAGGFILEPWQFVHRTDPMVSRAPHLFKRCSDNQSVGPPPQHRPGSNW